MIIFIAVVVVAVVVLYFAARLLRVYAPLLSAYIKVWCSTKKNRGAWEVYRGATIFLYRYRKDLLSLPCRVGKSLQLIVLVPTEDDVKRFDPVWWFGDALRGYVRGSAAEVDGFSDIVSVLHEVAGLEDDYAQQLAQDTDNVGKFPATPPLGVLPKIHFYVKGWKAVTVDSFQDLATERRFGEDYYVVTPTQEEVEALSNDTGAEVVSRDDVDLRPQEYMRVFGEVVGRQG